MCVCVLFLCVFVYFCVCQCCFVCLCVYEQNKKIDCVDDCLLLASQAAAGWYWDESAFSEIDKKEMDLLPEGCSVCIEKMVQKYELKKYLDCPM